MPRLFGVFLLFVILKVNFQNICYILEYYHFRGADCNNIPTDIKAAPALTRKGAVGKSCHCQVRACAVRWSLIRSAECFAAPYLCHEPKPNISRALGALDLIYRRFDLRDSGLSSCVVVIYVWVTVRDYIMIIEALDSAKRELERQAERNNDPYPPEVEQLEQLIEKVKNVTT